MLIQILTSDEMQSIHERLKECKDLARVSKSAQVIYRPLIDTGLGQTVPTRNICDKLVRLYINNFESTSRLVVKPLSPI